VVAVGGFLILLGLFLYLCREKACADGCIFAIPRNVPVEANIEIVQSGPVHIASSPPLAMAEIHIQDVRNCVYTCINLFICVYMYVYVYIYMCITQDGGGQGGIIQPIQENAAGFNRIIKSEYTAPPPAYPV
jgi:hypothetical protein